jgi:hypothetical protein
MLYQAHLVFFSLHCFLKSNRNDFAIRENLMRKPYGALAGVVLGLAFNLHVTPLQVSAQTTQTTQSSGSDDLSVMVAAVAQTAPTPAAEVSPSGTFWSAQNPGGAPLPVNLNNVPAWNLGGNVWLLDDLNTGTAATKSMGLMSEDVPAPPGDGGDSGGFAPEFSGATPLDTNGLWLEITNVANGWSALNLHNGTNFVYAILSSTSLTTPLTNWNIETELFPTGDQTNVLPFSVATLNRDILFVRAEDWTGVDSDGDGVPDWWGWLYWATNNLPDTNLDYSDNGNTFAGDYSNNIVPTVFAFTSIEVTNNYVNTMSAPVQLDVTGSPYYVAVSVDDTNYAADASWQIYTGTNIEVNLGLTEGWHDVWIGLRGHADGTNTAVWQWMQLNLNYTPPQLTITNPASGTVLVPMIQLQGYASKELSSLTFDVSNATGIFTNQPGYVTGQFYDASLLAFTTNYFQCRPITSESATFRCGFI